MHTSNFTFVKFHVLTERLQVTQLLQSHGRRNDFPEDEILYMSLGGGQNHFSKRGWGKQRLNFILRT